MSFEAFTCRSCGEWNQGEYERTVCSKCGKRWRPRSAGVHSSEKSVVYYNPHTGERRTPPRNDLPLPDVYARQGYERREIQSMVAYEKETGVIHEASNWGRNGLAENETQPRDVAPKANKERITRDLVQQLTSARTAGA